MNDSHETRLDEGTTPDHASWQLGRSVDSLGHRTIWIAVITADGARFKGGYGSPSLQDGQQFRRFHGEAPGVPTSSIARIRTGATSARAIYSDGSSEPLHLVKDPDEQGVLLAAHVCSGGRVVADFEIDRSSSQDAS